MQTSISRHGRRLVMSKCAVAAILATAPSSALAAPVVSDLRVEAGGQVLTNASFVTDTESFATDATTPACGGTGQAKTLNGPTALGLLDTGSGVDGDLRPLRVSDKFSFGLLVCGVGAFTANDTAFWLYKVNGVAPEVGGDAFKLSGGEKVLWYYQDTANNRNTGDELVVEAPARARPGDDVEVAVSAFSFNGARKPAAAAKLHFGSSIAVADANGKARIRLTKRTFVRAARGADIPSAPVHVCVSEDLGECPSRRGKRIFGTGRADRLAGTAGGDVIKSGAGNDVIDVRGGNDDRVSCGKGRSDRARFNRGDRVARDCEILNGRRRP